ncbi:MAG: methyltransferase domain-containing protein [Moraxellaceae bacterium]|nr:MAG: methyltransferase domain-containing protein [Moraxellaceae bacterium]
MTIICPLCHTDLLREKTRWVCSNQHSFDVAKQGYVNLLPVQHKNSKSPGDTAEAVQARRDFLQAGYYQPLKDQLMNWFADLQPHTVVDIGCGEGFYTSGMLAIAEQVIGVDIAKTAVQIAAKRDPQATWFIASAAKLPIASHSIDVVSSFFSPLPREEMARVLKADGYVLVATPASGHLYEMRAALFEQVNPHQPEKFTEALAPEFKLIKQDVLTYPLMLEQAALRHLIAMTPYAWKAKAEKRQQLEQVNALTTHASFQIYLFQKQAKTIEP